MDGTEWNPRQKHTRLANLIGELLQEEERDVRDVYYALEARGHDYTYDEVEYNLRRGRRAGVFDPSMIVDPSRRPVVTPTGITDHPTEWLTRRIEDSPDVYGRDFWEDQPKYVEVWLEKRGLAPVLSPICRERNVRLEPTRGDWSDSKAYRAAQRLIEQIQDGKDVRILYFGDYNPSGYRTPVAIQQMMYCYGLQINVRNPDEDWPDSLFYEVSPWSEPIKINGGSFDMERIALTHEQIERFDHLPENPNPSDEDSDRVMLERFKRHVSDGRDTNIELNALKEFEREFLEGLIEDAIDRHIDGEARDDHRQKEREHTRAIDDAIVRVGDRIEVNVGFEVRR